MTKTEYVVQLLQDGKWKTCISMHSRTASGAEILADLADARSKYPDATYRVGVRYIPDFVEASEPDLRLALITGGQLL